jgi:hypothetical protein
MCGELPHKPAADSSSTLAYCDVTGQRLPFGQWYHEWRSAEPRDLCPAEHAKLSATQQRHFKLYANPALFPVSARGAIHLIC